MEKTEFAHQVCAWIDPWSIIEAGIQREANLSGAYQPASLCLTSKVLKPNDDAGLRALVSDFLDDFRIPSGIMEILRFVHTEVNLSQATWNWLREIEFEGEIISAGSGQIRYPPETVMVVRERDCVADILAQPLTFLCEYVSLIVDAVSKVKGLSVFLNSLWPGPLGTYIESRVWAVRKIGSTGRKPVSIATNNRYRAVTVIGQPPFEQRFLSVTRDIAREQAAQTLKSVDSKWKT
jgi:hypothetical protein